MIKKIYVCLTLLLLTGAALGQAEYVDADNAVYQFLERMYADKFIDDYDSFEKPITRRKTAELLTEVQTRITELNPIDRETLEDFLGEYCFDLSGTLDCYESLISTPNKESYKYNFLDDNEKYLFFYSRKDSFNIFVNLIAGSEYISAMRDGKKNSAMLALYGGEVRGTLLNRLGFHFYGDNGNLFGDKEVGESLEFLQYNYKFNEKEDESFYDRTFGYVNLDFELIRFKIGNDTRRIGYGNLSPVINDPFVEQSYFSFQMNYKFLNFSFSHSKLMGNATSIEDPVAGTINKVEDKFLTYHRIGFKVSDHFSFGIGEMIVYSNRGIDLSYINPFSFYKTLEHQNMDRDNATLFFDVENRSIKGLRFFGTYMIDDINAGKIGTKWWGNQSMLHAGAQVFLLNRYLPLDLELEYLRISPYTFSHRINSNSFTNGGYGINGNVAPNSELLFTKINYRFTPRIFLILEFRYTEHGENYPDADKKIINVGGDASLGHRVGDSEETTFLDGFREYTREFSVLLNYEPIRNVILSSRYYYVSGNYMKTGLSRNSYIESKITIKI
ncbi:MAG: hypothetical protein AB9882_05130 [Ignavibacteriaceae bacterium]